MRRRVGGAERDLAGRHDSRAVASGGVKRREGDSVECLTAAESQQGVHRGR